MRLVLLLILCVFSLLLPVQGWAAAAFDAASASAGSLTASSQTWSHTTAGSERALLVTCGWEGAAITLSSVTYNAVSLGAAKWHLLETNLGVGHSAGYVLVAPATGANNIVATFSGATTGVACVAQSWTGIDQTTPNRIAATAQANGDADLPASVTVSNAVPGDIVVDGVWITNNPTITSTQTVRAEVENIGGDNKNVGTASAVAAGSTAMTWNSTDPTYWVMGGMALIPSSGGAPAGPPVGSLSLMGVGR